MNNLFTLYRYLAQNQGRADKSDPYNVALQTLEPVLDLLAELDHYGEQIRQSGGTLWDETEQISERIIERHRAALGAFSQSNLEAVKAFSEWGIGLDEIDALIDALQQQKQTMLQQRREQAEELGDLDDHPF